MEDYEAQRLENLKEKQQLLEQLNLDSAIVVKKARAQASTKPPAKKRRLNTLLGSHPTRTSSRLASSQKPFYTTSSELDTSSSPNHTSKKPKPRSIKRTSSRPSTKTKTYSPSNTPNYTVPTQEVSSIRLGWKSWHATAPPPTRDDNGSLHFPCYPLFTPNKSPSEILREGSFGGSYWRPLHSQKLDITIRDDWRELPAQWIAGLDVERYLLNTTYDPTANKFGVACGQSIEEWEAAGWINHTYDARGWFQWYCRFFQGRRCDDDDRQVGRWARCVGPKGRWRRMLLKKYVASGVRDVFDDGEDDRQVSPVMHQTCHHWAFEVRQGVLDEFWRIGK
jgi:hypothetical protein